MDDEAPIIYGLEFQVITEIFIITGIRFLTIVIVHSGFFFVVVI